MSFGPDLMADFKNKTNAAALSPSREAETPYRSRRKNSAPLPQDDIAHTAAGRAMPSEPPGLSSKPGSPPGSPMTIGPRTSSCSISARRLP